VELLEGIMEETIYNIMNEVDYGEFNLLVKPTLVANPMEAREKIGTTNNIIKPITNNQQQKTQQSNRNVKFADN
jgi:hypothetical protein